MTPSLAGSLLSATGSTSSSSNGHGDSTQKNKKQLLISYVRAEAANYALHLKAKLAELGYSVYLVG